MEPNTIDMQVRCGCCPRCNKPSCRVSSVFFFFRCYMNVVGNEVRGGTERKKCLSVSFTWSHGSFVEVAFALRLLLLAAKLLRRFLVGLLVFS